MSDFRLEDLVAIVLGLVVVAASLFSIMALIALWPRISKAGRALFRIGAWRMAPSLSTLADDLRERALRRRRVKAFRAATMIGRAREALKQERRALSHYVHSRPDTAGTTPVPVVPDTAATLDPRVVAVNFTEDQWFTALALARLPNGQWRFSGKKLYTLQGGNHNDFVARLKKERDGEITDTTRTPIADRPTSAAFASPR